MEGVTHLPLLVSEYRVIAVSCGIKISAVHQLIFVTVYVCGAMEVYSSMLNFSPCCWGQSRITLPVSYSAKISCWGDDDRFLHVTACHDLVLFSVSH